MKTTVIRHWDLLLHKDGEAKNIPTILQTNKVLLAWESTGHHHRIIGNANVYTCEPLPQNEYYLWYVDVLEPSELVHEEHNTIKLPIWRYNLYCQREYDPIEERRVLD